MPRCVWEGQSHTSPGSHPGGGTLPHRGSSAGLPAGFDVAAPACPWHPPNAAGSHSPAPDTPNPPHSLKRASFTACWSFPNVIPSLNGKKYLGQSGNPEEYQEKLRLEQTLPGLPSSQSSRSQGFCKQGKGKTSKEPLHPVLVPRGE